MKIRVESSGGIGNLRIGGEFDLTDLPSDLRARVENLLTTDGSSEIPEPGANPHMADGISYELTVIPENDPENVKKITVDEATGESEALEVGRALIREVVRRKKAGPQ